MYWLTPPGRLPNYLDFSIFTDPFLRVPYKVVHRLPSESVGKRPLSRLFIITALLFVWNLTICVL